MTKYETIKLLEISNKILEVIDNRAFEEMPRGDLQAVIEAQTMSAYYLGIEHQDSIS